VAAAADFIKTPENNGCDEQIIRIYTDGSKGEGGVGTGVVIFVNNELMAHHKFRLNHSC